MTRKETYFTPEHIAAQAGEMYRGLYAEGLVKERAFTPLNSALLVLDMQEVFAQPESHAYIPSMPAIIPGVIRLIDLYAARNLTVIFTQHLNTVKDAGLMAGWWKDLITIDHPLSALIPNLDPSKGQVICKNRYDAFWGTQLERILHKRSIHQVVICGVMTHLCCETTARSAFMRDFEVFFMLDGTATYNRQHHLASAYNLAHGFAVPALVDQIAAKLISLPIS
jgi:isochorismate hydrolase